MSFLLLLLYVRRRKMLNSTSAVMKNFFYFVFPFTLMIHGKFMLDYHCCSFSSIICSLYIHISIYIQGLFLFSFCGFFFGGNM